MKITNFIPIGKKCCNITVLILDMEQLKVCKSTYCNFFLKNTLISLFLCKIYVTYDIGIKIEFMLGREHVTLF